MTLVTTIKTLRAVALVPLVIVLGGIGALRSVAAVSSSNVGIVCLPKKGYKVIRHQPAQCTVLANGASFAEGVNLTGLRWRGWGASSTTATGFDLGFHLPYSHIPVALVAYRAIRCGSGAPRVYTRLRVTSAFGTSNVREDGC